MTNFLYHGTSNKSWEYSIEADGLLPRRKSDGCFEGYSNVGSHPEMVYMTNALSGAAFFSYRSSLCTASRSGVILKINFSLLDDMKLRIDENYLDVLERGTMANCDHDTRRRQREAAFHDSRWKESLEKTNLVAYASSISPKSLSLDMKICVEDNPYYLDELSGIGITNTKILHNMWLYCWWSDDIKCWQDILDKNSDIIGKRVATPFETIKSRIQDFANANL